MASALETILCTTFAFWTGDVRTLLLLRPLCMKIYSSVDGSSNMMLSWGQRWFRCSLFNIPAESLPARFFSQLGKNTVRSLWVKATWKHCLHPSRVTPEMNRAPQQKHHVHPPSIQKSRKPGNNTQVSPSSSTCGEQNATNRRVRGIASRWIYKGIVAVDCTESLLLLQCCMPCLSALCSICGASVLLDIKALDGPEATLKGKILPSLPHTHTHTQGNATSIMYCVEIQSTFTSDTVYFKSSPQVFKGSVHLNYQRKHYFSLLYDSIYSRRQSWFNRFCLSTSLRLWSLQHWKLAFK